MELIYLWTKKYKNLKGGYELSAKYNIETLVDSKQEIKAINLKVNKLFINNFFDKNNTINITAIIGENGSGKSSIMKLILQLLYMDFTSTGKLNTECFLIVEIDEKYYCISSSSLLPPQLKINDVDQNFTTYDNNFYTIYFNYMLDSLKDESGEDWIDNIYHKSDDYTMPILLEPYKKDNNVNINNLNYLTRQRMVLHKQSFEKNKFLNEIFEPLEVSIRIDRNKLIRIFTLINDPKEYPYTNEVKNQYESHFSPVYTLLSMISNKENHIQQILSDREMDFDIPTIREELSSLNNDLDDLTSNLPLYILNKLYIANKIDKYNILNSEKIGEKKIGAMTIGPKLLITDVHLDGDDVRAKIMDETHSTLKLRNAIEFHKYLVPGAQNIFTLLNHEKTLPIDDKRLKNLPSWFDVSFRDKSNRTFTSLSAGEKSFYILLTTLIYQINNIETRAGAINGAYYHVLIMLDEADLGLHPKWQRDYLHNIVESIKDVSAPMTFHIICTSHSPFIISDLPKDNILFLENGESTNLQNHDYTFSENIHTLLNDSFFMKRDMMMGKIAENKIKEVFDFFEEIFTLEKALAMNLDKIVGLKERQKKISLKNDVEIMEDIEKENKEREKLSEKKLDYSKKYEEKREYYINLKNIIGEEYIQLAFQNSIRESDKFFELSSLPLTDKDKILQAISQNPDLVEKWMNEINDKN